MFRARCAEAFAASNSTRRAAAETGRSRPTSAPRSAREIAREMFVETYGREPIDARELSGHLARISRQATTAVAGYDLTFSPVKSVSTLWAIAPREVGEVIEQAHHDAVADTLTWIENNAALHPPRPRRRRPGRRQGPDRGRVHPPRFPRRRPRSAHPRRRQQQGAGPRRHVAGPGRAGRLQEQRRRLRAVQHPPRGAAHRAARRPVRRPRGHGPRQRGQAPDPRNRRHRRRAASALVQAPRQIELRRAVLSAGFQSDTAARPPPKEAGELAQQATLETRQRKHEPRSYAEQRATWRAEAITVLGGEIALRGYLRAALHPARLRGERGVRLTDRRVQRIAEEVLLGQVGPDGRRVGGVQSQRAVWQENHIRAEAERRVRAADIRLVDVDSARRRRRRTPRSARPCRCRWTPANPSPAIETPGRAAPRRRQLGLHRRRLPALHLDRPSSQPSRPSSRPPHNAAAARLTDAQVDVALLESTANGVAQPRPGAARPRTGHLRRPRATRARPRRHRQDHRHAGAVPRLDRRRRHRHRARPVRRRRRRPARGDRRQDRHPRQTHRRLGAHGGHRPAPRRRHAHPPRASAQRPVRRTSRRQERRRALRPDHQDLVRPRRATPRSPTARPWPAGATGSPPSAPTPSSSSTRPAWPAPPTWPRRSSTSSPAADRCA